MIAWFLVAIATIAFFAFIAISAVSTVSATDTASGRAETINRISSVVDMLASQSAAPFSDGVIYAPAGQPSDNGYMLPASIQPRGITSFGTKFTYCPVGGALGTSNATVNHGSGSYNIRVTEAAGKSYVTQSNLSISGGIDPKIIAFVVAPIDARSTVGGCNQIAAAGGGYTVPNGIVRALSRTAIADLDNTMESGGAIWYVDQQGGGDGSSWSSPTSLANAFAAYRESMGGSFVIRVAEGSYRLDGHPLDQNTTPNPEKVAGSSLIIESPDAATLNIGRVDLPSDLTLKRVVMTDAITFVNSDNELKASDTSLGGIVLRNGATATLTSSVSVKGQPSMSGAIHQMPGSTLNVSQSTLTISYQHNIPSILAETGAKTHIASSNVTLQPGAGTGSSSQPYGFYYNPNTKLSVHNSTININGRMTYPMGLDGDSSFVGSSVNSNAVTDTVLFSRGGKMKLLSITVAGSNPGRYAISGIGGAGIHGSGDLYSSFRCWNRDPKGVFRMSPIGIAGASSGVSADEAQLATDPTPTAQQARDYQLTAARNTDRAMLRARTAQIGGNFECKASGTANTWVKCADENFYCQLPYYTTVRYGMSGTYTTMERGGNIPCNNETFGDPLVGTYKACYYRSDTAS